MNINEFFNQIIAMAQSGNWNGIWTLVLSIFATILGSVGGIAGIIAIGKWIVSLTSNKKFLSKIGTIFSDTKTFFENLYNKNKTEISEFAQTELTSIKSEISALQTNLSNNQKQMVALQNALQAFIDTVLNDDDLQLTYKNALKKLELTQTNTTNDTTINNDITDTTEITDTETTETKKKKIKLKDTNNE